MLAALYAPFSVLVVVAAAVGVYESRLYTRDQRSRAPLRSTAYLLGMVLEGLIGVVVLGYVAVGRLPPWGLFTVVGGFALVVALVQRRMHRAMGVEGSPLVARLDW